MYFSTFTSAREGSFSSVVFKLCILIVVVIQGRPTGFTFRPISIWVKLLIGDVLSPELSSRRPRCFSPFLHPKQTRRPLVRIALRQLPLEQEEKYIHLHGKNATKVFWDWSTKNETIQRQKLAKNTQHSKSIPPKSRGK